MIFNSCKQTPKCSAIEGTLSILSLKQDKIVMIISGSGDITALGKVGFLDAKVSGSGDLSLKKLQANHANVTINGSGDAKIWASDSISA